MVSTEYIKEPAKCPLDFSAITDKHQTKNLYCTSYGKTCLCHSPSSYSLIMLQQQELFAVLKC